MMRSTLFSEELRLLDTIRQIAKEKRNRSLSKQELAQRAGLSVELASAALESLAAGGHITYSEGVLTFDHDGLVLTVPISERIRDTEAELVRENVELRNRVEELESGGVSGLADQLHDEPARVVRTAEHLLQRGLTYLEVYYLGSLIEFYGPNKVLKVMNTCRGAQEPLRATYARIKRGTWGKGKERDDQEQVTQKFWQPPPGWEPY